jgi:flagellar basal body P-ring formation protein FlgA
MNRSASLRLLILSLSLMASTAAFAQPTLKSDVTVADKVVTIGDLFSDAGSLASAPLFLAPAPGTTGTVDLADIRMAAIKAGLAAFDDGGATETHVARAAIAITADMLTAAMTADLRQRNLLPAEQSIVVTFDSGIDGLEAATTGEPLHLVNLRYVADSGLFTARFTLAGIDQPLDLSGRLDTTIEAQSLVATLPAGAILTAADLALAPVSTRIAQNGNFAALDQLVGKQLLRQSRQGVPLKLSDVGQPQVIARSQLVTVYLHSGPLTLTIRGTALNAAAVGEDVAVMNSMSKRTIHGTARADGSIEIAAPATTVAGL